MIVVNFQSGALGNFLACVLHQDVKPVAALDYGFVGADKILHTGAFDGPTDSQFEKYFNKNKHTIITHNNPPFDSWVRGLEATKNIFIDLQSCFVEYRLNYITKMPKYNSNLNKFATEDSWKNFQYPIACDDARRIIRLHQKKEQLIAPDMTKDVIFDFENFYISDKDTWIHKFESLAKKVDVILSRDNLSSWHDEFQKGQNEIITKAKIIYDCIRNKTFVPGLSENEKGIIIGYHAVIDRKDNAEYFIETYDKFS